MKKIEKGLGLAESGLKRLEKGSGVGFRVSSLGASVEGWEGGSPWVSDIFRWVVTVIGAL